MAEQTEIETFNKFLVGVQGGEVKFMLPIPPKINKPDALLLAAWIVAVADDTGDQFDKVRAAVQNT